MTIIRKGRSIASASLIGAGGMAVVATLKIDYMSNFWAYNGIQGLGFLFVLFGSTLAGDGFMRRAAWVLFLGGSSGWFICWSWFLSFGLLIPVPLVFWAAISSLAYLVSTLLLVDGGEPVRAAVPAMMTVGSLGSTVIMAANPVFASDWTYLPVGAGAVLSGIIFGFLVLRSTGRPSDSLVLPTTTSPH
jgi:hypothetical protein